MNLPYFIAVKLRKESKGTFSASIQRLAVISIAVGLTSLLVAFMVLGGFRTRITEKIYSFSGHLLVTKYTYSTSFEESVIQITDSLTTQLENTDYVDRWQYYAYKAGLLKTDEEVQGVIFKGVDRSFDTTFFSANMVEGQLPGWEGSSDDLGYLTEVAISTKIARYLRLGVGDKIMIYFVQNPPRFRQLTISGIYETGLEEFDEKIILGDLNLIRRLNDWDVTQVGGVEVFTKGSPDLQDAQQDLFNALPVDLYVENVEDKYLQLFDWLSLLNRNVVIFLVLISLVACFSMVSILLILIMERTQMVGVLKAMGADNMLIRRIFISSGMDLLSRGLLWGNLIGLGVCLLQHYFRLIPLDPVNYYMAYVPIEFNVTTILGLNLLLAMLIGLSLMIPVSIISRIQPIRAIRFD